VQASKPKQGRRAGLIHGLALGANIFAAAYKRTSIQSKTGGMHH